MPPKKRPSPPQRPKTLKPDAPTDLTLIRDLAAILAETGLSEIELERQGIRVRVSRGLLVGDAHFSGPSAAHHSIPHAVPSPAPRGEAAPQKAEQKSGEEAGEAIKSPMVGTAYLSASPGAAAFIEVGQQVKQGQTLLIIEAMKTMNQIHAPRAGRVLRIHVGNGDPIEFGATLVTIE